MTKMMTMMKRKLTRRWYKSPVQQLASGLTQYVERLRVDPSTFFDALV